MLSAKSSAVLAAEKIIATIPKSYQESFRLFLTPSERAVVLKVCQEVRIIDDWEFNFVEFYSILSEIPYPTIELLWHLQFFHIFPLKEFLLILRYQSIQEEFQTTMCKLWLVDSEDYASQFVQTGLMSYFVSNAFNGQDCIENVCLSIIKAFIQEVFFMRKEDVIERSLKTLLSVWDCSMIKEDALHAFCTYTLTHFVKDSHVTVLDAFAFQENFKNEEISPHFTMLLSKMIWTLKSNDMECLLFDTLLNDTTNWEHYIVILVVFMRERNQATVSINGHTSEIIKQAFQNLNKHVLQKAILMGRQIAMNSKDTFPVAYKQWFLAQLSECPFIKNVQNFNFLVDVLSDLVPFEKNIEIIKIMLNRPLSVPSECQSAYADYMSLLKTRMKDLEPHVEPEEIVSKLLLNYQETGKIPSFIMEASLMRKHYYLNEFLPVLVTPRVIPNVPDLREKFIKELERTGKIPGGIFQKYRTACHLEKQKLLEGMNMECDFIEID